MLISLIVLCCSTVFYTTSLYVQNIKAHVLPETDSQAQNNLNLFLTSLGAHRRTHRPSAAGQQGHVCGFEHIWVKSVHITP